MSDDQDTTAPKLTFVHIKTADEFVSMYGRPANPMWARNLGDGMADAALEEMRVRAAADRVAQTMTVHRVPARPGPCARCGFCGGRVPVDFMSFYMGKRECGKCALNRTMDSLD